MLINQAKRARASQIAAAEWSKRHPDRPVPVRAEAISDGVLTAEEELDLGEMALILQWAERVVLEESPQPQGVAVTPSPQSTSVGERLCTDHPIVNPYTAKYCPKCGGRYSELRIREAIEYWGRIAAGAPF